MCCACVFFAAFPRKVESMVIVNVDALWLGVENLGVVRMTNKGHEIKTEKLTLANDEANSGTTSSSQDGIILLS